MPRFVSRACGACLLLGALLAGACAPTTQVHGYLPSEADIAKIVPGKSNAAAVEEALGLPSSSGLLRDSGWFYVQSVIENYTYNPPRVIDRTVLAIEFNSGGVVTDMARYGIEDGRVVNLTLRTTETGGRTLGVVEQLLGNLLNLDAENFVN